VIEYRLIMTGICVLCALAPAARIWPVIDLVITTALLTGIGLVLLVACAREAGREIRFRREMRALDARDAHRLAAARTEART